MRFIASILAFIVLFLAVQPVCGAASWGPQSEACCDKDCEDSDQKGADDSHEEDCKVCNPFQACACCSGTVTAPPLTFQFSRECRIHSSVEWPRIDFQRLEVQLDDFWQPPRAA